MLSTPYLPLLLSTLGLREKVPVRLPSLGKIEIFNLLVYLKPFKQVINTKLNYLV